MFRIILALAFTFIISFTFQAGAYPELVRHGYVNCVSCHISPSGGGILNDYGRSFSGEGLSTFARPGEESLFHGLIAREQLPKWLQIGGDIRGVQVHHENEDVRQGHFVVMQADAEVAVTVKGFTFDVAAGRFQMRSEEPRFKSRRFFLMYEFSEEWRIRVGRFLPAYGLHLADHVIATRRPLGFDHGQERYNIEGSWITDAMHVFVTASKGPSEQAEHEQESALTAQFALAIRDSNKAGINAWVGDSEKVQRQIVGAFATLGFTPSLHLLAEADWQWSKSRNSDAHQTGFFAFSRLGYDLYQGVIIFGQSEFSQTNLSDNATATERAGIGFQLFPRPHFDIQGIWTKQRFRAAGLGFEDYAWLSIHFYL